MVAYFLSVWATGTRCITEVTCMYKYSLHKEYSNGLVMMEPLNYSLQIRAETRTYFCLRCLLLWTIFTSLNVEFIFFLNTQRFTKRLVLFVVLTVMFNLLHTCGYI